MKWKPGELVPVTLSHGMVVNQQVCREEMLVDLGALWDTTRLGRRGGSRLRGPSPWDGEARGLFLVVP